MIHGQDNRLKRDLMMEELIKAQNFKQHNDVLDCDFVADYSFIMGDLNYRMNTTFQEMIENTDKIKVAMDLLDDLD